MAMHWDPDLYLKFERHRLRPARDLIARIPSVEPRAITDLGCGTGAITGLLAERFPGAQIEAIDSSRDMLSRSGVDGIRWLRKDIADWRPVEHRDVIFSNAALHWLPDHQTLFPRLAGYLRRGGALAVQMPRNFAAPCHLCIGEAARQGPWKAALESLTGDSPVGAMGQYYDMLAPLCASVDIWEADYLHALEGENPVADWIAGAALRPYLDRLDGDRKIAFESDVRDRLARLFPKRPDGVTLYGFRRLFIVAVK